MTDDPKPELNQTQMQMLQMLAAVQRRVLNNELIGVSFVVASKDRIPQHGYVAGPFAAGILAGGYLMAQADFVDFARSAVLPVPVNRVPGAGDPQQIEMPL
jgi:hypothetical protein